MILYFKIHIKVFTLVIHNTNNNNNNYYYNYYYYYNNDNNNDNDNNNNNIDFSINYLALNIQSRLSTLQVITNFNS